MTDRVISARNITVSYRPPRGLELRRGRRPDTPDVVHALRGVSFDVSRGEAFGVIGRNGAGKSTLLRVLARTLIPDEGEVEVRGRTSTLLALGVGFNPSLSGERNIILGSLAAGLTRAEAESRKADIIEYAELGKAIHRPLLTYSRGQQSRLAFAVARNLDPDILLIDEVLAVGDEAFKQKTLADMRELLARSGTIVFVSHALGIVREFCDRVLWLDEGETMQLGEPNRLIDAYRARFVRPEFDLVRDVTGGRTGVAAEPIREPRPTADDVDIRLLRAARAVAGPPELADMDRSITPKRAARRGRRMLASGWRDATGSRLALDSEPAWQNHDDPGIDRWDPVAVLLAAYRHDGYDRMLRPAVEYAVDWIASHHPDPLGGGVWRPAVTGLRAHRLAQIAAVACDTPSVSHDDARQLVASALDHALILEDPAQFDPKDPIALEQIGGMLALAAALPEIEEMELLGKLAEDRVEEALSQQFSKDGVHRRHSPQAHASTVAALGALVATAPVGLPGAEAMLRRSEKALEWFVTPSGRLAGFGDTDSDPISGFWTPDPPGGVGTVRRSWRTGPMRHAASAGRIGKPPSSEIAGFRTGGYFVVKTRSTPAAHLAMQCGFHSDSGKEADDLTIVWHDRGRDLLVDAGRYRGPDKSLRKYSLSTHAHNTVEVDRRNQDTSRGKHPSALSAHGTTSGVHYGLAEVELGGVTAQRLLAYTPGRWLLVLDSLDDPDDVHDFSQWFHAAPDLHVEREGKGFVMTDDNGVVAHATPLLDAQPLVPKRGDLSSPPQGWHSPGADVMVPNWAFGWSRAATHHGAFATVLSLAGPATVDAASCSPDQAELAFTIASESIRLTVEFTADTPLSVA